MTDMPRRQVTRRKRVTDYALGIAHETLWILGVTLLAFLMAIVAVAVYR